MTIEEKLTHQQLSVLQLAKALSNVTEAFRQCAVSRTQIYEYKRRFQTHGGEALKSDLSAWLVEYISRDAIKNIIIIEFIALDI